MTFIDDAQLSVIDSSTYVATLASTWRSMLDIHGGYVAAITARAIELAIDDPARALRSFTVQFIRPAHAGDVTIAIDITKNGRSATFLRAVVAQDERPVLTAAAVLGTSRDGLAFAEIPTPPGALNGPPPDAERFTGSEPGFHFEQLDFRLEPGLSIFGSHDRAHVSGWLAPLDPTETITLPWLICATDFMPPSMVFRTDRPVQAATVDMAIQLLCNNPSDLLKPGEHLYADVTPALAHVITWLDAASVDLDHIDDHLIARAGRQRLPQRRRGPTVTAPWSPMPERATDETGPTSNRKRSTACWPICSIWVCSRIMSAGTSSGELTQCVSSSGAGIWHAAAPAVSRNERWHWARARRTARWRLRIRMVLRSSRWRRTRARGLRSDRDVDLRRFDRLDTPPVRERLTDLALGHPARPPPARLVLAETEHEVVTANPYRPSEAGDERCPVLVVEHMEETTVEHHIELLTKDLQVAGVPDDEARRRDSFSGLRLRQPDRGGRDVDPHRLAPRLRRHQRMLAGTASNIEHSPSQPAVRSEGRERRLRRTDVPRRCRLVRSLELGHKIPTPGLLAHRSCLHRLAGSAAPRNPARSTDNRRSRAPSSECCARVIRTQRLARSASAAALAAQRGRTSSTMVSGSRQASGAPRSALGPVAPPLQELASLAEHAQRMVPTGGDPQHLSVRR